MKKGERKEFTSFPFLSNVGHLFLSSQSKYTPGLPSHRSQDILFYPLLRILPVFPAPLWTVSDNSNPLSSHHFLKSYCSYSLYPQIRYLIIYCLVLFSNYVMDNFSPIWNCNFTAKDQFSCFSVSPSAFSKYRHTVSTQRIIVNWLGDFSRLLRTLNSAILKKYGEWEDQRCLY